MADPAIKIVTLTVTEKGYCHIPSTGALNREDPDIRHDISAVLPRSAVGFIVRALQERFAQGARPFTVLSCDNLPANGTVARGVVTDLAREIDPALADWIASEGRFPSTMVDRIVPATTEADIAHLEKGTGVQDAAPVFHEPFLQWVVEDDFVDDTRPAIEAVPGVRMVSDVAPFEHAKLRMLNGTHSALAYLGYLAGHETIADTIARSHFRAFVQKLWQTEIIPTLEQPEGLDLEQYAQSLLTRYENPAIRHRTWQIAMDGSQKLPQRILGTILDNQSAGREATGLWLAVAGWMRYVGGTDEQNAAIDVRDPMAQRLRQLSDRFQDPRQKAEALLGVSDVFGTQINQATARGIVDKYEALVAKGADALVRVLCDKA